MTSQIRVAFVGAVAPDRGYSRARQRFDAMCDLGRPQRPGGEPRLGVEVRGLSTVPAKIERPDIASRVRFHLGVPTDDEDVNRKLVDLARTWPFRVLWLDKAVNLWPWTLLRLRRMLPELRVGAWIEEYVQTRATRSLYLAGVMPQVDCAFTPRSQNLGAAWLRRHPPRQLVLVDETYDPLVHRPWVDGSGQAPPLTTDVGFIGSYEAARAGDVLHLARNGVQVSVWGDGWERLRERPNTLVVHGKAVFGEAYAKALCQSRINLGFLRKGNRDRQTNRSVEIPACGAFMLAERTPEHMRLLVEGREAAYFSSRDEMLAKVRYYLAHEEERSRVARAGFERVTTGGFSHHDRLAYMLDVLCREQASPV